jgi:RNA polymerase sigma-70 factor, ECF subfamily
MGDDASAAAGSLASPTKVVALLQRTSRHDEDHVTWAYQAHVNAIYQDVYSQVGNQPDAEDLTATVFKNATAALRSDGSLEQLRGWLYRVAKTTLAEHWRRYYSEPSGELDENIVGPQNSPDNVEAIQRVDSLLSSLPESLPQSVRTAFPS